MDQRHPAPARARPGLAVAAHAVVELYPRAAVLTAWFNAWSAGAVDGLADCPMAQPDDPLHGSDAGVPGWRHARLPLGEALAGLLGHRAACVLPVPGDLAGLPHGSAGTPAVRRAMAAGQALLVEFDEGSVVIVPTSAAGDGRTVWHASRIAARPRRDVDVRAERLRIMDGLAEAMAAVESATLPALDGAGVRRRVAALQHVVMPPGSAGAAVELARSSSVLLAIVDSALAALPPGGEDADRVRDCLQPLGRSARSALAAAFSQAGGPAPR